MDKDNMDATPESNWINTILGLLKDADSVTRNSILESCGKECFKESGILEKATALKSKIEGLTDEEVLSLVQREILGEGDDAPQIRKKDGMIYLEYSQCRCSLATNEYKYDDFLCECTKGFAKSLVESVFDKHADVTILKTILRGSDSCLLAIRLL